MYSNKFVAAIKSNGKVLREDKDKVYLPFNSEYSILLKNLNTVRVKVWIKIDGQDVLDGSSLVINGNDELELKRFLNNDTNAKGYSFKFIERTASIEKHRGIDACDGLVEVTYAFEKVYPTYPSLQNIGVALNCCDWSGQSFDNIPISISGSLGDSVSMINSTSNSTVMLNSTVQPSDVGITTKGSIVEQKFHTTFGFPTESKNSIVIQLLGQNDSIKIQKPITVKTKNKCNTCGRLNKANSRYCSECGTNLTKL